MWKVLGGVLLVVFGVGVWLWDRGNLIRGYPAHGVFYKDIGENLLVVPKAVNLVPFYANLEDKSLYGNDQYDVYEIKEKKGAIDYVVGYFWGWEDINGTKDRVMKVKDGLWGGVYRFRVAMEVADGWQENETSLTVLGIRGVDISQPWFRVDEERRRKLLRFGRKVVVHSGMFVADGGYKQDADGAVWASNVIVVGE